MKANYEHSVSLDIEKCKGCTACLKRCPTEAIRIHDGHAVINSARCIDCGQCIKVCPYKAKKATHDSLSVLNDYKYTVALPAPSFYGQFDNLDNIGYIIKGLRDLGFDDVFEVACAAELVSAYTREYLNREGIKKPVISSACPTITRLISTNYPYLCENIMPILPPIDIAASLALKKALDEHPELKREDVGIIFISPCPAKVSYIKNNFSGERNYISAVLSFSDVYFALLDKMKRTDEEPKEATETGIIGIGWASTGGESSAILNEKYLAADGIENCIRVLDQIDSSDITTLEFVELNACHGGCVGGAMTVANPYIAQARLQSLKRYLPVSPNRPASSWIPNEYFHEKEVEYNPYSSLSPDRKTAMRMMRDIEALTKKLPGLDCGSCGAPTCMAFAEDVVKNEASLDECTVILKRILMRDKDLHDEVFASALQELNSHKKEETDSDGK